MKEIQAAENIYLVTFIKTGVSITKWNNCYHANLMRIQNSVYPI